MELSLNLGMKKLSPDLLGARITKKNVVTISDS
jgi:hypothetical protein